MTDRRSTPKPVSGMQPYSRAGYLVSGLGLGCCGWGASRLALSTTGSPLNPYLLATVLLCGLLLGGIGFGLLVVSSNPFEELEEPAASGVGLLERGGNASEGWGSPLAGDRHGQTRDLNADPALTGEPVAGQHDSGDATTPDRRT